MKIHKKKIDPKWFELRTQGLKDWEVILSTRDVVLREMEIIV